MIKDKKFVYVVYELDQQLHIYFVLENLDKIMHLRCNFDAWAMHSPEPEALDPSKSQRAYIILSKFTCKSK